MVTGDPDEARAAVDRGEKVVLIVSPAAAEFTGAVPGHLAVFVGDPADPEEQEAAAAMEKELFA